jgi:hypothetical protein
MNRRNDEFTGIVPTLDMYAVFGERISNSTFPKTRPGSDAPSAIEIKRMAIRFERFLYRAAPGTFYNYLRGALVRRAEKLETYRRENSAVVSEAAAKLATVSGHDPMIPSGAQYTPTLPVSLGEPTPGGCCHAHIETVEEDESDV